MKRYFLLFNNQEIQILAIKGSKESNFNLEQVKIDNRFDGSGKEITKKEYKIIMNKYKSERRIEYYANCFSNILMKL